jgi:hypothetical protein
MQGAASVALASRAPCLTRLGSVLQVGAAWLRAWRGCLRGSLVIPFRHTLAFWFVRILYLFATASLQSIWQQQTSSDPSRYRLPVLHHGDPSPAQHRPADWTAAAGPAPDPQPVPPHPHRLLLRPLSGHGLGVCAAAAAVAATIQAGAIGDSTDSDALAGQASCGCRWSFRDWTREALVEAEPPLLNRIKGYCGCTGA